MIFNLFDNSKKGYPAAVQGRTLFGMAESLVRPRTVGGWITLVLLVIRQLGDVDFVYSAWGRRSGVVTLLDEWLWLILLVVGLGWIWIAGRYTKRDLLKASRLLLLELEIWIPAESPQGGEDTDEQKKRFWASVERYGKVSRRVRRSLHDQHFPLFQELKKHEDRINKEPAGLVLLWEPTSKIRDWVRTEEREALRKKLS